MSKTILDRTLALAGVYQAGYLVQQTAHKGAADEVAMQHSIDSVLLIDAEDTPAVFGGVEGVALGLGLLIRQMGATGRRDVELARYAVSLLHLQRQLGKRPPMLGRLGHELESLKGSTDRNGPNPNLVANLARVYESTLSTLKYRIQVNGDRLYLTNPENINRIRALLLAGVRAAVLFRQCGGRIWGILLERRQMVQQARMLLGTVENASDSRGRN